MKFNVSGEIKIKNGLRKFEKSVDAKSEKQARDKIFAMFGSSNRLKRTAVNISTVSKS